MQKILHTSLLLAACWGSAFGMTKTITLTDYTGRGFAPDMVRYAISNVPRDVNRFRLTAADGTPVAFQLSKPDKAGNAVLSFVTDLPPKATLHYTFSDEANTPLGTSSVRTAVEQDGLVLSNALMAVKVPAPIVKKCNPPVAANTLPAPVLSFRSGATGAWLGAGVIRSTRLVKAWRVTLVENGPVCAEMRYEIDWVEGGYYHANIRVIDRAPLAFITEEYDLGKMADGDGWEINLTHGWSPDMAEMAKTWGNGGVDGGHTMPLADAKLERIQPYGAYGDMMSQLGLFNAAETKDHPDTCALVGVIPLHHGQWRRIEPMPVQRDGGQISMQLQMTRKPPFWVETSPFCVVTHEDSLPTTYARRCWGLLLNKPLSKITGDYARLGPCYQARLFYGVVGLDRYKDYITQWPDGKLSYPRAIIRQAELPKYAATPADDPLAVMLKKNSLLTGGDEKTVQNNLRQTLSYINSFITELTCTPTPSHHHTYDGARFAAMADDVLAWPGLSAQQRQDLRTRLALLTYLMMEPDCMGNGNGAHTGNPNMSIARQLWTPTLVELLPDHPMYAQWRTFIANIAEYKFADNMAPGGGWFEFGGYHMWGYARLMEGLYGLEDMKVPNLDKLYMYHTSDMDYY